MFKLLAVHPVMLGMVLTPSTPEAQQRAETNEPVYTISPQEPKHSQKSLCGWRNESVHS